MTPKKYFKTRNMKELMELEIAATDKDITIKLKIDPKFIKSEDLQFLQTPHLATAHYRPNGDNIDRRDTSDYKFVVKTDKNKIQIISNQYTPDESGAVRLWGYLRHYITP